MDVNSNLVVCLKWNPSPHIYIGGSHGAFGRGLQLYPLEPTLGASEELPRIKVEVVEPMG